MLTSTWKAAGLLALAAVAGGALGSAVTLKAVASQREDHGHGYSWYVELLHRELKLTPDQEDSVRAILARRDSAMDSIWAEVRPRIDAARSAIRAEITTRLTPEQQGAYRQLTARLDAERQARRDKDAQDKSKGSKH
jgi:Spy/CpxP family protein refolding chaperone